MSRRFVVIGAGVTGLSAARALRQRAPDAEIVVLERDTRIGGLVETEYTADGFLLEHGPDSLLAGKPAGMRAIAEAGLSAEVQVPPTDGARNSYVARDGTLVPLPAGLISGSASITTMMRAQLFSRPGRARMALEPLVRRRREDGDESIADFFARRFGREMVERLIDPVFRGVYGTPTDRLSLLMVMPHLARLEREHGSLGAAVVRRASLSGSPTTTAPSTVTLRTGMARLTAALAEPLRTSIRHGVTATQLRRTATGFSISLGEHGALEADGVVIATPAPTAGRLLEELDPELGSLLGAIRLGSLDTVSFGFRRDDVPHPLDGTGFVVGVDQRRTLTACTWSSTKWSGRAPTGTALLRCFLAAPHASDQELIDVAADDLRALMGIDARPILIRVRRRAQALPRYEVGHGERAASILERTRDLPGVALAGNAYTGMGLPDCIESGLAAADCLLEREAAH